MASVVILGQFHLACQQAVVLESIVCSKMRKKKSRGKKALRKSQPVGTQVNGQHQRVKHKHTMHYQLKLC